GLGIILLSSEFKEVAGLCDRIFILRKGEAVAEMKSSQKNLEQLYQLALGG
ncbi:MAG: sugar ABC transporter ATP-binding protein, partial [Candidatus Atribacteria bacterium]|nr:sugar ABC transporter ATP-binding protein [Candidatus Atribacteria bacterium]NLJ39767.1 sugar ABC transporter ATP-binding protein [Candidatus Atribacteria bacterium]